MKKTILSIFIFILFIFPVCVYADGTDRYYIDAYVNDDGSLLIKEMIAFSGSYNYLERNLYLKGNNRHFVGDKTEDFYGTDIYNASDIINICTNGIDMNHSYDFKYSLYSSTCFPKTQNGYKGLVGYYTYSNYGSGKQIRIYNPSSQNEAFYLQYTVTDAIVVHNDVAEVLFNFEWSEFIDDYQVRIHLPGESEILRVFSHGPVNGANSIIDKKTVEANWDFLNSNTITDIRVVFDKSLVTNATKKTNVDALDMIVSYETEMAEKQNEIREIARKSLKNKTIFIDSLSVLWLIGLVLILYNFYKKHDREYNSLFKLQYHRELPNTYGPEIVGFLFNRSNIKPDHMSASILEIIRKKYLKLEMNQKSKNSFTIYDVKDDTGNKESLTSSEILLKKWLIDSVGDGEKFTSIDLKEAGRKHAETFLSKYNEWKNDVIAEGNEKNFFENNLGGKTKSILYSILGVIIFILSIVILEAPTALSIFSLIFGIFSILYIALSFKRTQIGNEEYAKWKAFKNFLMDFGRFKEKELPEIVLWEKYLVYATAFGIADRVEKAMNVKIKEMSNTTMGDMVIMNHLYMMNMNRTVTSAINQGVSRAITQSIAATSAKSSGSGFGGGASFGGGGGGFGGGGGRG